MKFKKLLRAAGLDPLKDIDSIAVSTSGNPMAGGKLLVVVRGDFDPDKVRMAAEDYAKKHPGRLKSFTHDGLPMWEITSDNKSFYAAFAGNKTLVMTATKADTAAVVGRAAQTPQRPSKALQTALAHLKGRRRLLDGDDGYRGDEAIAQERRYHQGLRRCAAIGHGRSGID